MQQHLEMGRSWKKNIPETSPPPKEREEGMLQINFFLEDKREEENEEGQWALSCF